MSNSNVPYFYRIFLGCFLGLCCAFFPVSVAAQSAAINMSSAQIYSTQIRSNVSFGTGAVTANLPRAASDRFYLQAANDAYYRGSVVRLNTKFNATSVGMMGGLRNMLRVNPAHAVSFAVVAGLLSGVDWLIDNADGNLYKSDGLRLGDYYPTNPPYDFTTGYSWSASTSDIEGTIERVPIGSVIVSLTQVSSSNYIVLACALISDGGVLVGSNSTNRCLYSLSAEPLEPISPEKFVPVSNDDINALQFPQTMYDPDFWGLNFPLSADVASYVPPIVPNTPPSPYPDKANSPSTLPSPAQPVPAFEPEPEPPVIEQPLPEIEQAPAPAPDGAIQEVTKETVCNWSGNELVCSQQITKQVYEDGVPVGDPEVENVQLPQTSDGLTDCALFPSLCEWLNWTKEPPPEAPDLVDLISDFEPEEDTYSINLGAAECPAPVELNLAFIGTDLQLSYEPVCDFLSMVRPLILASAYLLAAYIYLGVLRG